MSASSALFDEDDLRHWLTLLRRPDQLADPGVVDLLRAHGRLPRSSSPLEIGRSAADLIVEAVDRLRAPDDAPRQQQLPYLVLKTCFLDGRKLFRAAMDLGMSERQLSRERTRAIALLHAVLSAELEYAAPAYLPEQVPAIDDYISRPSLSGALHHAIEARRLVHVHGALGIGKTALVAEVATELAERIPVMWLRLRQDVNDSLGAILFELGEHLRSHGSPRLAAYMDDALPAVDIALATRLGLQSLGDRPRLVVLDDYHIAVARPGIAGLIDEMVTRLPQVQVVAVSRRADALPSAASISVPAFTRAETAGLLARLSAAADEKTVTSLHRWTGGIPHLIKLAAAWVKTCDPGEVSRGTGSLNDLEEVQAFLLNCITELVDVDDRVILEAASIFRERFTDDALASVAGRTRGEVQDASRRLVRVYLATRRRDGDCSFFHTSVRDYVYERLNPERRVDLHARAATWYQRHADPERAQFHLRLSGHQDDRG